MRDLYLIFCDLNTLVMEQSDGLEEAQRNVVKAHDNVVEGQKQLYEARKMSKRCCTVM
jgi:t-SNARE complex subunit (syntaxin)